MNWDLAQYGWRAAVEIMILAVGIYYASIFVRGTRGAPVVTGYFLLMLILTVLTIALNLEVLRWLFSASFFFLAVAGVVIFQPELRRMLAELGTFTFFNSAREQLENIEVLVDTAERLSDVRIGAIIAIQQAIDLQDTVESGLPVDCEATPEMLETIFFPNNPIHDGGVLIVGDRIAYAACIFPLTQRQDLNKSLGTRHRAAIGLTEETDAVVIVVSEETGSISYAYKGQMVRGLTPEELRSFLTSIFIKPRQTRGLLHWFKGRFSNKKARLKQSAALSNEAD